MISNNKMLIQYVRDDRNRPVGCVLALSRDLIGWSKCCKRDLFDKRMAKKIAEGRALRHPLYENLTSCPYGFREYFDEMMDRAVRYYKEE